MQIKKSDRGCTFIIPPIAEDSKTVEVTVEADRKNRVTKIAEKEIKSLRIEFWNWWSTAKADFNGLQWFAIFLVRHLPPFITRWFAHRWEYPFFAGISKLQGNEYKTRLIQLLAIHGNHTLQQLALRTIGIGAIAWAESCAIPHGKKAAQAANIDTHWLYNRLFPKAQLVNEDVIKYQYLIPKTWRNLKEKFYIRKLRRDPIKFKDFDKLVNVGSSKSIAVFFGLLDYPHGHVGNIALESLCKLGNLVGHKKEIVDGFVRALRFSNTDVVQKAVVALGELRDKRAIPGLIELLKCDVSHVCIAAGKSLKTLGAFETHKEEIVDAYLYESMFGKFEGKNRGPKARDAAKALGELGDKRAIPGLINLLRHSGSDVRITALESLKTLGAFETHKEKIVDGYLDALASDKSEVVSDAAKALAEHGDKKIIPKLIDLSCYADAASKILKKFAETHKKEVVDAYMEVLTYSNDLIVSEAAKAFGELGDRRAIPGLIGLLRHSNSDIRISAKASLQTLGAFEKHKKEIVDGYLQALVSDKSEVVSDTAKILGELGDKRAIPGLINLLRHSGSDVRIAALESLKTLGAFEANKKEVVDGYYEALASYELGAIKEAAEALFELGDKRVFSRLIEISCYKDIDFKIAAEELLEKFAETHKKEVVDAYIKALGFEYGLEKAAYALGELGDKRAIPGLIKLLNHKVGHVCRAADSSLKTLGAFETHKKELVDTYIKALGSECNFFASDAAIALGELGDKRAIPGLIESLGSGQLVDLSVNHSLKKLAKTHKKEVVDGYLKTLSSENNLIVWGAAETLGELGDKRAIPGLIELLDHKYFDACIAAKISLKKLGAFETHKEEIVDEYLKVLVSGELKFVREAAEVLAELGSKRAIQPLISAYIRLRNPLDIKGILNIKLSNPKLIYKLHIVLNSEMDILKASAYEYESRAITTWTVKDGYEPTYAHRADGSYGEWEPSHSDLEETTETYSELVENPDVKNLIVILDSINNLVERELGQPDKSVSSAKKISLISDIYFGRSLSQEEFNMLMKLYGAKTFHLAQMMHDGIPVPDGFVISPDMTDEELKASIDTYLDAIGGKEGVKYAVRSSPYKSMPGVLTSKTNVSTREEVLSAIKKVRNSWDTPSAKMFRQANNLPDDYRLPIIVQIMIQGDKNGNSCSGVLFTRDPASGEDVFSGRFAVQTKGEDIVLRTNIETLHVSKMEDKFPASYSQFYDIKRKLEERYKCAMEVEFVIEGGKLWLVQARLLASSPRAKVKTAVDMVKKGYCYYNR